MSRTYRRDIADVEKSVGENIYSQFGESKKVWKNHADRKKWYKPGKKAKKYLHKGFKAKLKQELASIDDFDNLPAPRLPKSDAYIWL